jgi:hypothetical protein
MAEEKVVTRLIVRDPGDIVAGISRTRDSVQYIEDPDEAFALYERAIQAGLDARAEKVRHRVKVLTSA